MNLFQNLTFSKIILLLFVLSGYTTNSTDKSDYPLEPELLGSIQVKWAETTTPDGWTMVTNEGGTTLGYYKGSGLNLIQVDGYAFKDLNRNNLLDQFVHSALIGRV